MYIYAIAHKTPNKVLNFWDQGKRCKGYISRFNAYENWVVGMYVWLFMYFNHRIS